MNKRASVLMIVLWILAALVLFALGLGHRASIHLKISSFQKDRIKAGFLARAGIQKAIFLLEQDADDPKLRNMIPGKNAGLT